MAKAKVEFEFVPLDDRLKKSLKENQDIAKETQQEAQKAATSVGQLMSAVTAGIAGAKVIGFFKEAVASANRLEQSLARVESAARAFGQSTTKAKEAAQDLAKDGFLSLNQSASSLSNLMATGLNVEQSKKFITAAKDISAFGNTIGDAAESVESGIKGILTGSSELVENMSPKMKTLSMRFTENKNKVGEAKAAQILYNDVLKLGTQFQGDAAKYLDTAAAAQKRYDAATERAAATIGQALQPAVKSLYNILTGVVDGFTKWFNSFSSGAQMILLAGAALVTLIPVLATVFGAMGGVAAMAAKMWLAIAGPIGYAVAGIIALTAVIVALHERFANTKGQDLLVERNALLDIQKKQQLTLEQKQRLKSLNEEIAKSYNPILKALGAENASLSEQLRLVKLIDKAKLGSKSTIEIKSEVEELKKERAERLSEGEARFGAIGDPGRKKAALDEYTREIDEKIKIRESKLTEADEAGKPKPGDSGVKRELANVRFIETQKKLAKIEQDKRDTIALARGDAKKIADAEKDAEMLAYVEVSALRQAYAEYIEDKAGADQEALEQQTANAIRAVKEQENAGKIEKERAEEDIQKIREAHIRKQATLRLQSYADTLGAANQIANGALQLQNAKGNVGEVLSGFGGMTTGLSGLKGLLPSLGFLGPAGAALGAAGGLISTFSSLFGKSDEERAKEAADQARRDEEAKKLLEIQAEYQKRMLNIQEANAKLPFENLQRQLRLIDIKAQQAELAGASPEQAAKERLAARSAAIQGTINSQSGTIGQGELFKGFTPTAESLTNLLSTTAGQGPSTDAFITYASQALGDVGSIQQLSTLRSQMESLAGAVPKEIADEALNFVRAKEANFWKIYNQMHSGDYNLASSKQKRDEFLGQALSTNYATAGYVDKFTARVDTRANGSDILSNLTNRGNEFKNDVATAENLISVIEQGNATQLEIAKNTKETAQALTLEKDRSAAFIDIAGGGIRGFGQLLAGTYGLNSNALQIPKGLSNAMLASVGTKSLEQQGVEAMQKMLSVNMDMRELLAEIAINTNRGFGDVSGSLSESDLLTKLQSFKDRS